MKHISGLSVIECRYCYNKWRVEINNNRASFSSAIRKHQQLQTIDLFHQKNTYAAAGVPVVIHEVDYNNYCQYEPYEGVTRDFSDAVCAAVSNGNAVVTAGGYCNYAPAIVGGIQRAVGEDKTIGVIWMDAHADCRIAEKLSEPVRLVGVPLSTMLGVTLDDYRKNVCGLSVPCKGENILAGDMRIMDEMSAATLQEANVHWVDASIFANEAAWNAAVQDLAARVDVIYLSVDADILKFKYIPSYEKEVPYGHDVDVVARNVRIAMETNKVCALSLFCFDFDHYERDGHITCASAAEILNAALRNWKKLPLD